MGYHPPVRKVARLFLNKLARKNRLPRRPDDLTRAAIDRPDDPIAKRSESCTDLGHVVVAKVWTHPLLHLLLAHALAPCVIYHLVLANLAHLEVCGARVGEDESRDGGGGQHSKRVLDELDAGLLLGVEQLPHERLLGVIGLRWVAGRRPNASVLDLQHVVNVNLLVGSIAPDLRPHLVMEKLGEGLGKAVGDRLHHDPAVVVVLRTQLGANLLAAEARGDSEGANVVLPARVLGRDEVGHGMIGGVLALLLLPQCVELAEHLRAVSRVNLDVVTHRVGGPYANDALGLEYLVVDDLLYETERVGVQLLCLLAHRLVVENLGVASVRVLAAQLPHLEERVPVDEREELGQVVVVVDLGAEHVGRGNGVVGPVHLELMAARLLERVEFA
mmetsp:Transcript_19914/g.42877  ORF Transcript_19914/g.42877 Transcript_19914/m.42877 type:complete len:388 (+) Transcript_19914:254-1417(+)